MGRMTSDILWKIKAPWCWCLFTYKLTYKPGWFWVIFREFLVASVTQKWLGNGRNPVVSWSIMKQSLEMRQTMSLRNETWELDQPNHGQIHDRSCYVGPWITVQTLGEMQILIQTHIGIPEKNNDLLISQCSSGTSPIFYARSNGPCQPTKSAAAPRVFVVWHLGTQNKVQHGITFASWSCSRGVGCSQSWMRETW